MGVEFRQCLLFEDCAQKIAEVQLSIRELLVSVGLLPPFTDLQLEVDVENDWVNVLDNGTLIARVRFFPFVPEQLKPVFDSKAIEDKIINCGWVPGELVIEFTPIENGLAQEPIKECINLNMKFQEIEEVPGLKPEQVAEIVEFRKKQLGTIVCLQLETRTIPLPLIPSANDECPEKDTNAQQLQDFVVVQDPTLTIKHAFIAVKKVLGFEQIDPPLCSKKPLCPHKPIRAPRLKKVVKKW